MKQKQQQPEIVVITGATADVGCATACAFARRRANKEFSND
jgi:NADP-dependent 3-hydroxy acid dehydrogenase YdfG